MGSRLDGITDWDDRARRAGYDVAQLAANVSVSRRRLEQFFRETLGLCPRCLLQSLRMADAQRLLLDGWTIKEVAFEVGYRRDICFYRAFREAVGVSPQLFVKEVRAGLRILPPAPSISQNVSSISRLVSRLHFTTDSQSVTVQVDTKTHTYETGTPPSSCSSGGTILVRRAGTAGDRG